MLKKMATGTEKIKTDSYKKDVVKDISEKISDKTIEEKIDSEKVNTILKGSTLKGDISVTCDLELSGDVEGNITSDQKSNIVIKGNCKGNIKTREGSVEILGQMSKGDITAGGDTIIIGRFNGGKVEAKGTIFVNGEFSGTLEGNIIEIGPDARGKGELFYKDSISISKGANIEGHISKFQGEHRAANKSSDKKVIEFELPILNKSEKNSS